MNALRRSGGLVLLTLLAAGCAGEGEPPTAPEVTPAPGSGTPTPPGDAAALDEDETSGFLSRENQRRVYLFFPDETGERLAPEERVIFLTNTVSSQVKQAVSELLLGPQSEGLVPAFPTTTRLRAVFLLPDGTAVLDLGPEATALPGGTSSEMSAIYSLVNTVVYNFQEIRRVKILVQGREVPTLLGHLDTSQALGPDLLWVDWTDIHEVEGESGIPMWRTAPGESGLEEENLDDGPPPPADPEPLSASAGGPA